jgi:hypothetical protein
MMMMMNTCSQGGAAAAEGCWAADCSILQQPRDGSHSFAPELQTLAGAALEAESYLFAGLQAGVAAAKMGPGVGMSSQAFF